MQPLATIIREQLETLIDQYDARLSGMPGYSSLPETMRRDLERSFLNLIAQSVEAGDYSLLVQHAQQRATQWAAQGLNLMWFQQALSAPEEILAPLIQSVETSNFVWQALNRSQGVIWQMIAERTQHAEAALAQERSLLHTLIDSLPDQIFFKDTTGRVILNNMADARAMGLASPAEAVGKNVFDLYPAELAELYHADDMAVIQSGQPLFNREEPGIDDAGQTRWIQTTKVPLTDSQGQPLGLVGIAHDITQRRQIESTLQESEERFRRFSEATTEGLTFHDKGLILDANPAIVTLFGFTTAAELVGRNLLEFIVPDSRALVLQKMQIDDVHPYEVHCIRKDGSIFPVETSTRVYQYRERTIRATAVRDITERKQLEQHIQESLELREYQVQTGTEVSQEIAAAPDLGELFKRVVTLIKERFNYYHAQIFRYDLALDAIVLVTGYGEVGQHMLADGHRLQMGRGVVGTAAANGQSILATDVTQDADWRPNPHLPETKGELAVPIKLRDEVLGILDVQSDQAGVLSTDDRLLLEGLCGQIAIAIDSTRLLESAQQSEQLMRTVINSTSDWIFIKDQEHRYRLVNQGYANSLHIPIEEFIGKNDLELGFPEELVKGNAEKGIAGFWADDRQVMDGGETKVIPNDLVMIDGVLRTYNTIKTPLRDAAGQVWGVLAFGRDITERKQAEETLNRERNLLRILIDNLPLYVYIKDRNSKFVINNKLHLGVMGAASQEEVIGKGDFDFFPPENAAQYFADEQALMEADQLLLNREETVIDQTTGQQQWVSSTKIPYHDAQGNVIGFVGLSEDITARKQAELRLQELLEQVQQSERLMRTIIDAIPDSIYAKDTESRFTMANLTEIQLRGAATFDELRGKNDFDRYPRELAERYFADEQPILRDGLAVINREEQGFDQAGNPRWQLSTKVPLRDGQGNIVGLVGTTRDISERRQAEAELARSAQLLDTIIQTVPDLLYVKNTRGEFMLANNALAQLMGATTTQEMRGKTDFDFFPRELAEKFYRDDQLIFASGQALVGEEELTLDLASGFSRWTSTTKVPFFNSQGQIEGLVGLGRDISARKQAEVERERLMLEQQKRALQLQTASDVSRAASSILKLDELLPQAVELIRVRFGFYYVGIFLADDTGRWAVLRAGTGAAGQDMLTNAHQLEIGGASMIGQCINHRQSRVALDVGQEAIRFDNPLLPLTRSEMALPLTSRGRIIGAMTIQSEQPAAFTPDDVTVLQNMADQISNAVENARLYEQTRAALQEVDAINRRLTGEAWETYLHYQSGQQVISLTDDSQAAPELLPQLDDLLAAGEITIEPDEEDPSEATVSAPILLRGQPIGVLRMRTPLDSWDKDTAAILTDIAGHVAQAVENARLIEQTQRTASRERAINEINARVRQTIDLDAILRTAVNELGQSLRAARVTARINTADDTQASRRLKTDTGPLPAAADRPRGNDHD